MVGYINDGVLEWQKKALCINVEPSIFFDDESAHKYGAYKAFCNNCPVKSACLEYCILYNMSGIWGGTTEKERRRLFSKDYVAMLRDDAIESGVYNFTLKA